MHKLSLAAVFTAVVVASGSAARAADLTIKVDAGKEGVKIGKELYGVFLEEIGHGVDGGLYGEMLQNRAFEDAKAPEGFKYQQGGRSTGFRGEDAAGGKWVDPGGYATTFVWEADKSLPFWSLVAEGGKGAMSLDMNKPLNANSPRACKVAIDGEVPAGGRVGIANEGWCAQRGQSAVGIKAGEKYELTFYARGEGFSGNLMASVEGPVAGGTWAAETTVAAVPGVDGEWKQFKATLTATKTDNAARFVLAAGAGSKGTVWFDMVSLFPAKTFKDRPNGLRADIAQMLADLKPGFVRFPGGCVVEAATVETVYNWKNTIGPVVERPECWNAWDYRRTHGMGMYEYLQFIEDIGATPMYVGFAGQTCVYRQAEVVPMEQMQPWVDAYVDLAEYANGAPTTKWGKLRAESGHPAPFNMHLMEIGNENNGQVYTQRYGMILQALKAAHPEVMTIADLPMRGQTVEMIDDHHYESPSGLINTGLSFDGRDRRQPPLYLGEVAVTSGLTAAPGGRGRGGNTETPIIAERGNVQAALAEGTLLMSAEKNADVVKMVSYAPLLGHINGLTELAGSPPPWHAMIYFDSVQSYGTASYYLWKTFGTNRPSVNLQANVVAANAKNEIVGNVGVGTWGTSAEYKDFKVEKDGKVLYAADFANGTAGWTTEGGRWSVVEGAYRQTGNANGFAYVGEESWSNYIVSVKARKQAGGEGFLVIFGHKGADRYWWNIGGWGNTRHEVELNQAPQGNIVNGQNLIEANRWYDIKIVVDGLHIQCFLDGKLIHDVQATGGPGPLTAVAGRDDATGEIVVKVINRQGTPLAAGLDLAGLPGLQPTGKMTVLKGTRQSDNNSLAAPTAIVPVESEITGVGAKFEYEFPAYSLTVLRLMPRK